MVDPLSALAVVKGAISAGKGLHSMTKELSSFFESCDTAKQAHQKKKSSIFFSSSNEEALDTWVKQQQSKEAEAELREIIVNSRGYSAYQDLLKLRRAIAAERKEEERQKKAEAEEFRKDMETLAMAAICFITVFGILIAALYYKGYL